MNAFACFAFVCFAVITLSGCHRQSANTPPAGSFRLVVDKLPGDGTSKTTTLTVFSTEAATLSVTRENSYVGGQLLILPVDQLRQAQSIFSANRVAASPGTNASVKVSLQVKSHGGDGGMLIDGSFGTSGETTFTSGAAGTNLDEAMNLTAQTGVYPLDQPLNIGRIDGKPVTLTVGKPAK